MNFGDILRETRMNTGEDLMSVARKLRIRPDILQSIEAGDLENMPPRGYSRNMVNAYARYLGLNPTEVVKSYLDAQYNAQVASARKNVRPTGFDMSGADRHHGQHHGGAPSRAQAVNERETNARGNLQSYLDEERARTGAQLNRNFSSNAASDRQGGPSQSRSFGGSGFDEGLFDDLGSSANSRSLSSAQKALAARPSSGSTSRIGSQHVGAVNAYGQGLYQRTLSQTQNQDDYQGRSEDGSRNSAGRTRRLDDVERPREPRRSNLSSPGSTRRLRSSDVDGEYTVHRSKRNALVEENSFSVVAAPRSIAQKGSGMRDKLPFLIAGAIILLLVVLIGVLVSSIGSQAASNAQQSTPMNITGLPDSGASSSNSSSSTSSSSDSSSASSSSTTSTATTEATTAKTPTSMKMSYTVASGSSPYIEVYLDGTCVMAETVSGPATQSFDVTGEFKIISSPYEGLTVTQEGSQVSFSDDDYSNGILTYSASFSDYLTAWNEAHASTGTASTTSTTTSTNTSSTTLAA